MRKIYQLDDTPELQYELDPRLGPVKRSHSVIKPTSTTMISHAGQAYEIKQDLTFEVPDDVADFYLRQPGWNEGVNPFADGLPESAEAAADLKAKLEELKAENEKLKAEAAKKPAAGRSKTTV